MTKKKKSRIRIILGLVLCVLLLAGTAGLVVADKKVNEKPNPPAMLGRME